MAQSQLTPGGVQELLKGVSGGHVRIQIIACKKIEHRQNGPSGTRYKILASDGNQAVSCILASQLAPMAANQEIRDFTIVEIHECLINHMTNKTVLIVLTMSVVEHLSQKIGNPVTISPGTGQANAAPSAHQQPQLQGGIPPQSAPPAYGAPPVGGNYGAPPTNGGYGGLTGAGAYGAPGQYGQPPQQHSAPTGPYGDAGNAYMHGQPPLGGYGAPPPGGMPTGNSMGYGAPVQPDVYKPAAGGAIARNEAPPNLMPINALNSYQNRWTIMARVTQKTPVKRYSNARGEGRFFSFDLLDKDGGEIRAVGWNDNCDRFCDQVEAGKVYYISKASLRTKKGTYNQTRHQFEIHLENGTEIQLAPEESSIPTISFNFVRISQLEDTPPNHMVDVIGIAERADDITTIRRKDGSEATKRSISVRDPSGRSIEVTLWGDFASNPGDMIASALSTSNHPVVALKSVRVGAFNGKNLSTVSSSAVMVDPSEVPETRELKQWYASGGANQDVQALSGVKSLGGRMDRRISISQIQEEGLGLGDNTAWVQVVGHITYARNENFSYPACPLMYNGKQCNKKLIDQTGDGTSWYCERCGSSAPHPEHRYILSFQLGDHTEVCWATAFNETAPEILGVSAGDLKEWGDSGSPKFSAVFRDLQFKLLSAKLKVTENTYSEGEKRRINVVRVDPVDFKKETSWTLEAIKRLEKNEPAYPEVKPASDHTSNPGHYGGNQYKAPATGGYVGPPVGGYGGPPGGAFGGPPPGGFGGYGAPQGAGGYGGGYGGPGNYGGGGW